MLSKPLNGIASGDGYKRGGKLIVWLKYH